LGALRGRKARFVAQRGVHKVVEQIMKSNDENCLKVYTRVAGCFTADHHFEQPTEQ
jgi:hypothetical protein